jgi:hypothetical protein
MKNNFKNKNFIKNSKVLKILNINPKSIKVIPKQELVYLNLLECETEYYIQENKK